MLQYPPNYWPVMDSVPSEEHVRGKSFGISKMLDTLGSVVGPLILFLLLNIFQGSESLYHKILLFSAVPLIITLLLIFKLREVLTKYFLE